ncbi:MAG: biopolymer transporter ExbD [Ignavibacteriaceae bacterium]|nr:biopolymer transporter ExbD [Ignavibacteriaceae bacterium]
MAGADVGGGDRRGHKKKKGRPKRRTSIRIDMTPMVDVAFLLLTFFMLTTVFRRPQTLEIKLPPSSTNVQVSASNLLIIRVDEDHRVFQSTGLGKPDAVEFSELGNFFRTKAAEDPNTIILVKLDRKSKYHYMVDIIDELNLAKLSRYSVATLSDVEKEELAKIQ